MPRGRWFHLQSMSRTKQCSACAIDVCHAVVYNANLFHVEHLVHFLSTFMTYATHCLVHAIARHQRNSFCIIHGKLSWIFVRRMFPWIPSLVRKLFFAQHKSISCFNVSILDSIIHLTFTLI